MCLQVFALFLETLCELVTSHKADLYDWLYVLLTRYKVKDTSLSPVTRQTSTTALCTSYPPGIK